MIWADELLQRRWRCISAIMLEDVVRFRHGSQIADIKDELEFVPKNLKVGVRDSTRCQTYQGVGLFVHNCCCEKYKMI